ncbi:hypothetical protein ACFQBQ_09760 [Granulicella cerasi]|uniref:Uncharacterized protein n=1 Tax=Granulicella cerasi TaxID=741063 RepID=A0ABW1Z9L2_9BACT|nr:hypothetical protein [Granulicella cerasi]
MPTKGHEGHDAGQPEGVVAHPHDPKVKDSEHPGYEIQDINVGGVITFIAGLAGFIFVFFIFCFFMGKAINYALQKQDGPRDQWHQQIRDMGETQHGDKRQNLASNAEMEQKQLATMAQTFPGPRLETDDGNQDTADLHAKEDLLLDNYSTSSDLPAGTVRIPVERAMDLIVERGLPKAAVAPHKLMVGETSHDVHAPLTTGFARTGYELSTIQAREQKLEFEHAEK